MGVVERVRSSFGSPDALIARERRVPPEPLISVVIPNHNYGRYLSTAIDSALAQTYPHVEVVVVDDGSTDGSRETIGRYRDRVQAVFQKQAGQAAAAWAGIREATGDVVVFLDADDLLDREICGRVADTFGRDPTLSIVQWRLRTIDAESRPLPQVLPPRPGLMPNGDLRSHVLRIRNWHYQPASGVAYAAWAARSMLPARLPEGEHHALDQWLNELLPILGPVRSLDDVGGSRRIHDRNFSGFALSTADWPRRMIMLTLNSHEGVRRLAAELGLPCPEDARDLRDPAFLGWQLWSLTVDPAGHPFPAERRRVIGARGILASLAHPHLPWRQRVKRSLWFAAVSSLPRGLARRLIARYPSDGPIALARKKPL